MIPKLVPHAYRARFLLLIILTLALALGGCADRFRIPKASPGHPIITTGTFVVDRSTSLPYRAWLPKHRATAIVLALHGFNDSRDAWASIAPSLAAHGIALFAPDLPGFGTAPIRGFWPGTATLLADTRAMVADLRRRYPHTKLTLIGESMGGAIALILGAEGDPSIDSYVLISPAVWGGAALAWPLRASLAIADTFAPWLRLTGQQAGVRASDNRAALIALGRDPLTIHATRVATLAGLTRLMGRAQGDCARFRPHHALVLYGGHDQLIPKSAMVPCWRALKTARLAYYPHHYHLMLLDHAGKTPATDITGFILHPTQPLHSDAATNAMIFLAQH